MLLVFAFIALLNDLACRFEGDKYAIILPDTTNDGALIAAEKLFNTLKTVVIKNDSKEFNASVSIAVLQYNVKMDTNEFIDVAERKLIQGQNEGGNRIIS